ncbi:uncharacterized protein LOC126617105 [Malus sylvestris]|uniref:uncharacterized protein LOC126617105 n=1 Tax=Malus sylvestris TaxID=3752 RepID=UPI0021AC8E63|nr:uncharacterized protein LOC126617105 [Malus sylvestris]
MVIESPENWHEKLGNTLWAYRTSKRVGTGTTPYALTFGQDAVLPMEINVSSVRIQNQFGLHNEEYIEAMCQGIEDLDIARIETLNQIQEGKKDVARAYNKKVKMKSFKEGDLVWKTILPLGAQLRGFGKWSPTWEGPFTVSQVLSKWGYYLADLEGKEQKHPINPCPTSWPVKQEPNRKASTGAKPLGKLCARRTGSIPHGKFPPRTGCNFIFSKGTFDHF